MGVARDEATSHTVWLWDKADWESLRRDLRHTAWETTAGRGGQYVTSPDFTPPGTPKTPRPTPRIRHQTNGQAMVWLSLPCCFLGYVVCLAPLHALPDSAQQGSAWGGLQEDGGNKQMGITKMGGGPAPQITRPRRWKQNLAVSGQGERNQPPRFHPSSHQAGLNSGHQQQGEGPAVG